ncbi:hypothetical protein GCM10025734_72600 [Kitasatospora paranensis]
MERPASAGAVDRALAHCAATVRYTCAQLLRVRRLGVEGGPYPGAAALLAATARTLREAGAGLRASGPVPVTGPIEAEIAAFDATRAAGPDGRTEPVGTAAARLGLGAVSLDAAEGSRFLVLAVRVSRRAPLPPDDTPADQRPGPFWYAHAPAAALWWRRFRANLTPRSVYFQNALRIAAALGAARLVAGALDLSHGFWVLLATLTLMRTSAVDTRMTLRPALTGTACGAAATAALLIVVGERPAFYAAALPPVMLIAFTVGPMLGLAWAQGTFTVVVALVFTQLAPVGWRLAEARLVNVATGAAIGILAGLCAWPRGGGQELRRRTAELLTDSALALRETVAVVTGTGPAHGALRRARLTTLLTEASYAQYRSERHDAAGEGPNWQAALLAGQHTVRGAEPLLARMPAGTAAIGPAAAASLVRDADRVAAAFDLRASALLARVPLDGHPDRSATGTAGTGAAGARAAVSEGTAAEGAGTTGPAEQRLAEARDSLLDEHTSAARMPADVASLHTVDVVVWLGGLLDDLARVTAPAPRTAEAGSG